jgi:hypothetical protein
MGTLATGTRYLKQVLGITTEQAPIIDSAGAGDANKIPALDAAGRLDQSFMPVGIGADTKIVVASEALAAGDYVNLWDNAGVLNARKADATAVGKEAHGFVLAAVLSTGNATVYFDGSNTQVAGMTVGADIFLHTTAGAGTATCPSTGGNIAQKIGKALSATEVSFEAHPYIVLA